MVGATGSGQEGPAVRAEGRGVDAPRLPEHRADGLSRFRVPEAGGAVLAARQNGLAVGTEDGGVDEVLVAQGRTEGLSGRRVPEPGRTVRTRRHGAPPVR